MSNDQRPSPENRLIEGGSRKRKYNGDGDDQLPVKQTKIQKGMNGAGLLSAKLKKSTAKRSIDKSNGFIETDNITHVKSADRPPVRPPAVIRRSLTDNNNNNGVDQTGAKVQCVREHNRKRKTGAEESNAKKSRITAPHIKTPARALRNGKKF